MSRATIIKITCDICEKECENDHVDVRVSYQGQDYILDLCDLHWSKMDETFMAVLKCGTTVKQRQLLQKRMKKLS